MNYNTWKNILAATAILAATVSLAPAQEITLRANVPFEFSVNHASNLAPGKYTVTRDRNTWLISNRGYKRTVLVLPRPVQGARDEAPALVFQCVGHNCQLQAIRAGNGELGGIVPTPKLSKSDRAEIATITVPLEIGRGE
jgi:hypothetical protein